MSNKAANAEFLADLSVEEVLNEVDRRIRCAKMPERRLILIGPPGSGKGSQAPQLKAENCLCHLATGDMLRAAVAAGTEMGKQASAVMKSGGLVSDDIVVGIINESIKRPSCERGFILDGFPRTVPQAEKLDSMLAEQNNKIDAVINMEIPDAVLLPRISGRLVHPASGRSYHKLFNPPKQTMIDDLSGEPLIQRPDDNEAAMATRLEAFHKQTMPVIDYYAKKGLVRSINADQPFGAVYQQIKAAVRGSAAKSSN